jgi:hypothetical protein
MKRLATSPERSKTTMRRSASVPKQLVRTTKRFIVTSERFITIGRRFTTHLNGSHGLRVSPERARAPRVSLSVAEGPAAQDAVHATVSS